AQAAENVHGFVHDILGRDLPVGITEWNYDPGNPPPAYGDDGSFMTKFTTAALLSMARGGIAFACQFDAASYGGYGRLDIVDLNTNHPTRQYYAWAALPPLSRPPSVPPPPVSAPPAAATSEGALVSLNKPAYCSQNNSGPGGPGVVVDGRYGDW